MLKLIHITFRVLAALFILSSLLMSALQAPFTLAQDAPSNANGSSTGQPSTSTSGGSNQASSEYKPSELCQGVFNLPSVAYKGESTNIIAIMGESISPDAPSSDYTCNQIIGCLKEKWPGSGKNEALRFSELKEKFGYCIIAGKDGLELLQNYAGLVYRWIAGISGSICILTIVISGIQRSIGGLSEEEVSGANDRIYRALGGLVVLLLSAFILYTINPIFFQ